METEHRSAISVVFVLLVAGTMAAVAVPPAQQTQTAQTQTAQTQTAQTGNVTEETSISVSATGDAETEPDLALVYLESSATADDPQTASERLAANVSQLRTALRDANVSEDQIRTTDYNLYEVSERDGPPIEHDGPPRENETTRYRAQQAITVEVSNTSRVGELIDVAVANGASSVRGIQFTLSEETRSELRSQALEEAMGTARSEAETLASTEDLQITGVRSISTDTGGPEPFAVREGAVATEADTQIDSGPVIVRATVQVTYNATG